MSTFITSLFLRIFFPKTCISCRKEDTHLCEDCVSLIPINTWLYPPKQPSNLDGLFCATPYQNRLIKTVIEKYKNPPFLKDLSLQLSYIIISHLSYVYNAVNMEDFHIVAVPLNKKKLKWRGFNQSEEIAKELSKSLNIPFNTVDDSMENKNILLVDDIYETGNTMETVAVALKEAGANTIWGVVVARR